MSINDELGAALDRLIPNALANVITLHRDHAHRRAADEKRKK